MDTNNTIRRNRRPNRGRRPNRRTPTGREALIAEQRFITLRSFPGEQVQIIWCKGATQLLTTSGTSYASVYAIGNASTQIGNFTDFSNLWDQYVILEAVFEIQCATPPTPGFSIFFFDGSANAAVPVAADEYRTGVRMTNHTMNNPKTLRMKFDVVDNTLLSYRNTTVDYIVGYFKAYTDNARFGTSAANTLLYRFTAAYRIAFRGRKV